MSKFFITGGAGFLGINLTRFLLNKGHNVVSYDFAPDYNYPEKDDKRVTVIKEDIRHFDILSKSMAGSDIVIHTAAALPLYSEEDIRTTDIDGTRNVFLAAKQNGIKTAIQISSTAVYGIPDHHPLLETDKLQGVGAYGIAKVEAESICAQFRKEGITVPIIRPKSFIGPERLGVFALFYDWAESGHNFPLIGSGNNKYQFLDVEDLCEAIYLCATLPPEKTNDVFNIGAEEFTTMKEDYQVVLDKAGFKKRMLGFPAAPLIWTLRILEFFKLSPLYKWIYETACEDSFVSIDKAKEQLGWKPKFSNKDALLRNYEWYIEHKNDFKDLNGVSHRVPWKQGILKIAKMFF
ncbi:MAG: NAD(P)-dependent oxidoreductase [Elusimicrobiota bacterium]|nr:NAD(P)-dependent oxidoreductase [Elusimicrobiota bacterium]